MKTLYLDIFSGMSGDMFLGAMIDLGVSAKALEGELRKLGLEGWHIHAARAEKSQISGIKFDVHLHEHHDHAHVHDHDSHGHGHDHGHEEGHAHSHADDVGHSHGHEHQHEHEHEHGRDFAQIRDMIQRSELSAWVKEKAVAVFQRVAVAEGKIHGVAPERVHFHEVGAVDSIIDIVGGCVALDLLGRPLVLAGPVVEGHGWIECAHGRFPIPAPATLEILSARSIAVTQCDEPQELLTPTGAALLAEFAASFGPMRNLAVQRTGFGLGTRDNRTRPNVLRAILGETGASADTAVNDWETDTIAVLETNLDDVSAEILGHFSGRALAAGALDVFFAPIQMKKNRPGVLLTILCAVEREEFFAELMLRETSAFGVRRSRSERWKLRRESTVVATPVGEVTVKLGRLNGKVVQAAPEYESCRQLAEKSGQPLTTIYAAALRALKLD